jgi:hypothetical protein
MYVVINYDFDASEEYAFLYVAVDNRFGQFQAVWPDWAIFSPIARLFNMASFWTLDKCLMFLSFFFPSVKVVNVS